MKIFHFYSRSSFWQRIWNYSLWNIMLGDSKFISMVATPTLPRAAPLSNILQKIRQKVKFISKNLFACFQVKKEFSKRYIKHFTICNIKGAENFSWCFTVHLFPGVPDLAQLLVPKKCAIWNSCLSNYSTCMNYWRFTPLAWPRNSFNTISLRIPLS